MIECDDFVFTVKPGEVRLILGNDDGPVAAVKLTEYEQNDLRDRLISAMAAAYSPVPARPPKPDTVMENEGSIPSGGSIV